MISHFSLNGLLSRARGAAALVTFASILFLGATPALATSFDFVSSGGQFTIASGSLSFGNGLTISSAENTLGEPDSALINSIVLLDPIVLTGSSISLPGGLVAIGIDNTIDYALQIFERAENGGARIAAAVYSPGDFFVIGASGLISAQIADDLSNLIVDQPGFSDVIDELGATPLVTDFNVTLSAAGQNMSARIASGGLVAGSMAGSVATVVPEPSTAILFMLGLGGLASFPTTRAKK